MKPAQQLAEAAQQLNTYLGGKNIDERLKRPLIILSAPRAGSTLLFEQLQKIPGFWSIGGESHIVYASLPHLRFANPNMDSGALTQKHADAKTSAQFKAALLYLARNHQGLSYGASPSARHNQPIQLLEKTPRNALAVPFLNALFPNARYIYLHRQANPNIASIASAWEVGQQSGRFVTYPQLADFDERKWCFLLPPSWRDMKHKSFIEIACFQWQKANQSIIESLKQIPADNHLSISYESLVKNPQANIKSILEFCGLASSEDILKDGILPLSKTTLTPPQPNKWKQYEAQLMPLADELKYIQERINRHHSAFGNEHYGESFKT